MKLATVIGAVSGLAGATGGGFTYSGMPAQAVPSAGLTFSTKEQLNKFKGGACVNALLRPYERDLVNKNNVQQNEWTTVNYKFKETYGLAKGCVAVYWHKNTWDNGNWKGTFRYEWVFTLDNDILVNYGLYDSQGDNTKISWRSIYTNRNTEKTAWKTWDVVRASKMPKLAFPEEEDLGFNADYGKMCQQNKCKGDPIEKQWGEAKWRWKEKSGGSQSFSEWAENYPGVFGDFIKDLHKLNSETTARKGIWWAF